MRAPRGSHVARVNHPSTYAIVRSVSGTLSVSDLVGSVHVAIVPRNPSVVKKLQMGAEPYKAAFFFFSPSAHLLRSSILLWLPLLFISEAAVAHGDDQERLVLFDVRSHWSNAPALSSWDVSSPYCNWPGIRCSNGSVTSMSLPNISITEPIPPFFCNLTSLAHLDLSYNEIPGGFPTCLYSCSNLQYLDLSQNFLVGELPSDIHKLSSQLLHLDLSYNNFTGDIPPSIGRLLSLHTLNLHCNFFDGSFPAELGNLSMLESLTLAYNPFASPRIPVEFGNMTRLKYLWMTYANLVGEIPEDLGRLAELDHLDLARNGLSGSIPAAIWSLEKLTTLYLYDNKLTGEISGEIAALNLAEIDVSMNRLTGSIPEEFVNLRNLRILFMYNNNLSGEIPRGIGLLRDLRDIRLFDNHLVGVLPPELGQQSHLTNLEVSNNRISGSLPQGLCANRALKSVVVFNNNLTGELPASLADCYGLNDIQLYNNNFSGEFPRRIWSASVNLTTVLIDRNHFTGVLPDKLQPNLTRLVMNDNRFSGRIPTRAPRLLVFRGSNNMFSGEIPAELTGMSRLQVLLLHGNRISGSIPTSISKLKFLTQLDLSDNHLSGGIPAKLGLLEVLTNLDLSNNRLSGSIPPEIGNLKLNILNLTYNKLTGEVPLQLQNRAYERSFLSNPGLCSSKRIENLNICAHAGPNKLSERLIPISLVLGGVMFLMLAVTGMLICRRRSDAADLSACKLTSFHQLDFTQRHIIRGLTEASLIGSGGSGQVYRVNLENRAGDAVVAVKKIRNSGQLDWKMEKAFEAEVKVLSSIRHCSIVKLLCCISSADSKLLVYEYMEKGSLDQWLYGRRRTRTGSGHFQPPLDWRKRLGIAIDAAKGLCYMHHHCTPPVIHRDVKSSNILLDSNFGAKIADFGLARMLMKASEPESASAIAGTFGYMAPECGHSKKINEKVDVYSFGVVLLELTTGRKAQDGGEHEGLAGWAARRLREKGGFMEMIDEELSDEVNYTDDMGTVVRLGIECTRRNAVVRPSMKEVLRKLTEIVGLGRY
ncbi:unnamed protein product [Musa banksii]